VFSFECERLSNILFSVFTVVGEKHLLQRDAKYVLGQYIAVSVILEERQWHQPFIFMLTGHDIVIPCITALWPPPEPLYRYTVPVHRRAFHIDHREEPGDVN